MAPADVGASAPQDLSHQEKGGLLYREGKEERQPGLLGRGFSPAGKDSLMASSFSSLLSSSKGLVFIPSRARHRGGP